ncbi:SpoIID/LytB domain-containing protein [Corallococcus sp. M34]|uniref:SpoIID/LytB domain-containing protein n=1 Tax=Citreicoccus inhibens TaxID=2849499 RepID=UPI001C21B59A|nr:SpoIID/LytB domain-containing protein [Citreicoccus inhibens]MBU8895888.1 SpoIID/LytB domain-containing protein [Citreicoccus inhibens]
MGWAAVVATLLAASPTFVTRGDVTPEADLRREAEAAWASVEAVYVAQAGSAPTRAPGTVVLQKGSVLSPERNAQGRPGWVELRQNTPGVLDERLRVALRHELAHQFLWWACPASSEDRLFHEAFALMTSGELAAWREAPYQSLSRAATEVALAPSVDTLRARRGLARILGESPGFPASLTRRLRQCQDGARWLVPLSLDELADVAVREAAPATLVLSRHSGEVLLAEGDVRRALPYGSTLKPFVYAASREQPVLPRREGVQEWACGPGLPDKVDARTALLRSCNGYFLDWEAAGSAPRSFGAWGPVLSAVGLAGDAVDMAEAIGLRSTRAVSPWGMAQAYRLLAEARPDVMALLADNAARGTLSDLPASSALVGVATKTGTVRDAASRPQFGWIVAVDGDVVAVLLRPGKMPRQFADEVPKVLARGKGRGGAEAARVQVLGLVAPTVVEARCPGLGFALEAGVPRAVPGAFSALAGLVAKGPAVCLGMPWRVRFPDGAEEGRDYAGVFTWDVPPAYRPPPGVPTTPRALKARRGSDFVFRTTRLQYVAGVVTAEDALLTGEARVALARVVAHNERHSRHPDRAVCDTTHCQAFRGTVRAKREETRALSLPALPWDAWLPFSQGGDEPWKEERPREQVEAVLGKGLVSLRFDAGRVLYLRGVVEAGTPYEDARTLPCELLRSALKLLACPRQASFDGERVVFEGQGKGHGEGLDVEAAKSSGLSSDALLQRAYGKPVPR